MGRLTRSEARSLLKRRDRNGLTWNELSASSGVPVSTLQLWQRRLRDESEPPELIEVSACPIASSGFVVEIGSIRVHVPQAFDSESLHELLAVLARC